MMYLCALTIACVSVYRIPIAVGPCSAACSLGLLSQISFTTLSYFPIIVKFTLILIVCVCGGGGEREIRKVCLSSNLWHWYLAVNKCSQLLMVE